MLRVAVERWEKDADDVASQATAAAFLRAATQLEELKLRYGCQSLVPVVQELLTALASSSRAARRNLDFTYLSLLVLSSRLEEELAAVLPRLPALQCLILGNAVSQCVVEAINPGMMPQLRGLCIPGNYLMAGTLCAHFTMHHLNLCQLLTMFSNFYLVVSAWCCTGEKLCEHCLKGCHSVPWPSNERVVGFFTRDSPSKNVIDGLNWGLP